MSEPKPVLDGPKKGWTRTYCISCGHQEFHPPMAGGQQQQQPQLQPPMPTAAPRPAPGGAFQPILIKRPPSY